MDINKVKELALKGERIRAIQLLREGTGWGLRETKDYVDALASGNEPPASPVAASAAVTSRPQVAQARSLYKVTGVGDELEVFEDKLTITPKGVLGFLTKGLKGTKTIPLASITAVQHKRPGLTNGYLQFTIAGGNESRGGVFDAVKDENSFMFTSKVNAEVDQIKAFIEERLQQAKRPVAASSSVADELLKLAELKRQGVLSEEEFTQAKQRLLGA